MNKKYFNKKTASYFQILVLIVSMFAFSYFVYYSSSQEKNPLDNLILNIKNQITKPIIPVVSAATLSTPSVCCEKTNQGAYCINTDASNCDLSTDASLGRKLQKSPTSCESTSFCKQGTCYDSKEGICMENTPQTVCQKSGGIWDSRDSNVIPQCQLGCCVIADQAAFVPLVRCKRLSTFFGVTNIDYKKDITSEVQCIATAQSQDTGACVFEKEYETTCTFQTRKECNAPEGIISNVTNSSGITTTEKRFYKDMLCSAEELGTNCARQTSTGCYQQKVYWLDSCGNRENVYSSDKDKSWNKGQALAADSICKANDGSNLNCGNCDYMLGSRCGAASFGAKPATGDFVCKKTTCKDINGKIWKNGESWCITDGKVGNGTDAVGSRYFRDICIDGEVHVEPCADFRNEICIQGGVQTDQGLFSSAGCRVNRWQDCLLQTKQSNCENTDRRDCMWLPKVTGLVLGAEGSGTSSSTLTNPTASSSGTLTNPTATGSVVAPITGNSFLGIGANEENATEKTTTNRPNGVCVPINPPGLKFWEEGDASGICGQASLKCVVNFEKKLISSETCVENCDCLEDTWAQDANRICTSLGDCGGYVNYVGKYTQDGYEWMVDGKEKKFSANQVNKLTSAFTGKVTQDFSIVGWVLKVTGYADLPFDPLPEPQETIPDLGDPEAIYTQNKLDTINANLAETYNPVGASSPALPAATQAIANQFASAATIRTQNVFINGKLYSNLPIKSVNGLDTAQLPSDAGGGFVQYKGESWSVAEGSAAPKYGGSSTLSQLFNVQVGGGFDAILTGLQWGAVAYGIGYLIGSIAGMSSKNTQALALALGGGTFVWQSLATYNWAANAPQLAYLGQYALPIGIGVAVIIFLMLYKKDSTQIVTFSCLPWQAPTGGSDCEKCNNPLKPCSEYRCKSLGGSCEIVNPGTTEEKCINNNRNDVEAPTIKPDYTVLTTGLKYADVKDMPPSPGFKVVASSQECIKAFTPVKFGITTNEPAQCKIEFNHTEKFDDMQYWFGGTNLYLYNHTEQMALPGPKDLENVSLILNNGGKWTFFIRCRDKNGNVNSNEYAVRLCIDPTPDNTAPEIKATSITNGGCVAQNNDNANVNFYVNEPAECKWSRDDKAYENMENTMICQNEIYQLNALQLYTCTANLTGIAKDNTRYYVRCKDQPDKPDNLRNKMQQSYQFTLRGSNILKLKDIFPNSTVYGSTDPATVTLSATTLFGCDNGKAICYYSTTGNDDDYIQFFQTNDITHSQKLDLTSGNQLIYVKCIDFGGNVAINTTSFNVEIDTNAPVVARVYNEGDMLKIVTVKDSDCAYSFDNCDFSMQEGIDMPYANSTTHTAEWKLDKTYYIKCSDQFRNEPADCSIIVRPYMQFI